jgi:hypothetical protein
MNRMSPPTVYCREVDGRYVEEERIDGGLTDDGRLILSIFSPDGWTSVRVRLRSVGETWRFAHSDAWIGLLGMQD